MKKASSKILVILIVLVILFNLSVMGYGIYLYTSLSGGLIASTGVGLPLLISTICIDVASILLILIYIFLKSKK